MAVAAAAAAAAAGARRPRAADAARGVAGGRPQPSPGLPSCLPALGLGECALGHPGPAGRTPA
eukprot:scaffold2462_cov402-Prasinococcus_capsulatus_cf.AAC.22